MIYLYFNSKLTTRYGSLRLVHSQGEKLQVVEKELQKQIVLREFII